MLGLVVGGATAGSYHGKADDQECDEDYGGVQYDAGIAEGGSVDEVVRVAGGESAANEGVRKIGERVGHPERDVTPAER